MGATANTDVMGLIEITVAEDTAITVAEDTAIMVVEDMDAMVLLIEAVFIGTVD